MSFQDANVNWKRLDGSAPPDKVYFKDQKYDSSSRTFTGTIDWGSNTFFGADKQVFNIQFTEDLDNIIDNDKVKVLKKGDTWGDTNEKSFQD